MVNFQQGSKFNLYLTFNEMHMVLSNCILVPEGIIRIFKLFIFQKRVVGTKFGIYVFIPQCFVVVIQQYYYINILMHIYKHCKLD
jgi:hypothetical protein